MCFQLDDWVLCRIYKKRQSAGKVLDQIVEEPNPNAPIDNNDDGSESQQIMLKFPRTCSLSHLLELDYNMGPISQLLSENTTYNYSSFDFPNTIGVGNHVEKLQLGLGEIPDHQYTDSGKFQVNRSGILNQQAYMNPKVYQFHQ